MYFDLFIFSQIIWKTNFWVSLWFWQVECQITPGRSADHAVSNISKANSITYYLNLAARSSFNDINESGIELDRVFVFFVLFFALFLRIYHKTADWNQQSWKESSIMVHPASPGVVVVVLALCARGQIAFKLSINLKNSDLKFKKKFKPLWWF